MQDELFKRLAVRQKMSRVNCDRIVAFDSYEDGSGTMQNAQTLQTGDGWSTHNLATNPTPMQG